MIYLEYIIQNEDDNYKRTGILSKDIDSSQLILKFHGAKSDQRNVHA